MCVGNRRRGFLFDAIHLTNIASNAHFVGGAIPLNKELKAALLELMIIEASVFRSLPSVISAERLKKMSSYTVIYLFGGSYRALEFISCSSHRGWRTAILGWARQISSVGGSLHNVQVLAD